MANEAESLFRVRPLKDGDERLIMDSWVRCYGWDRRIYQGKHEFNFALRLLLWALFDTGRASFVVLALRTDPDHIAGWLCFSEVRDMPVIHFIFIKRTYRPLGLFWPILAAAGITPASKIHYTFPSKRATDLGRRFVGANPLRIEEFIWGDKWRDIVKKLRV